MTASRRQEQGNVDRQADLVRRLDAALDEALQAGWYGEIVVRIPVVDGYLQTSNGNGGLSVTTTRQQR